MHINGSRFKVQGFGFIAQNSRLTALCCLLLASCLLTACLDDDQLEQDDSLRGNFEAFWQTLDEHYCFFDEKGVDWEGVHRKYAPLFNDSIKTQFELFSVLDEMVDTLRDGHINVYAPFNIARYWSWYEDYPANYDDNLVREYYLGTNYWYTAGMQYVMYRRDSVAYVRYSSFNSTIGATNLDYILALIRNANGLILDIRNNGGGSLTNAVTLAERFATEKTLSGYIRHKTGPGHNDFSKPEPLYVEPADDRMMWDASVRPVVILTNRHCFSAANNFVQLMRTLDGTMTPDSLGILFPKMIKICGDRTGGGSGLPFESVLPNGWSIRFSACPMTDPEGRSTESGIDPSPGLKVDMDSVSAFQNHRDDIIEAARQYIIQNTRAPRETAKSE